MSWSSFLKARAASLAFLVFALLLGTGSYAIAQTSTPPEITSAGPFTVNEGETAVATLAATDSDTAFGDLTWSTTGGADSSAFSLSSAGVLAFASAKDYEQPDDADSDGAYEVTVQVNDGANTDSADLVVTLGNVIELTALTGPATVDYAENKAVRAGTYSASSEADNDGLSWSLSGDDADDFRIDEPGGVLRFDIDAVSPNLFPSQPDFEAPDDADADGVFEVTVEVGDGTDSHTLDVEVTITDEDEDEAATLTLSTTRPRQGEAVTATLADEDGVTGTPTYVWERSEGRSDWVTISGAIAASYTPDAAVTGHFLRVTASYDDEHGSGHAAEAMSKEVVVAKLLHSLAVTTDDTAEGADWRQFKPTFDARTLHYSVGCNDSDTMSLTLSAQDADARMAVDGVQVGNPGAETATTVSQVVSEDSAVRITLTGSDGGVTTYVVHCIPDRLDEVTTVKRTQTGITEDLIMFPRKKGGSAFLVIIDNNGVPRFIREPDAYDVGLYFRWYRIDEGNEWRYAYGAQQVHTFKVVVLDQNLEMSEDVQTVAPLQTTDFHDYWVLPNGNYLLLAYEPATRDFSFLPFGTHSRSDRVQDSAIQVRTPEGQALYTWNSFDHMGLEDCNVNISDIGDYAHVNSLQMLDDGDIIASFRRCHKILRIDPDEDKVVWRVGPTSMTDEQWEAKDRGPAPFKLIGDPEGEFAGQHAAQLLPNGHLIMFDNGQPTMVNPWTGERKREDNIFGRGVEYAIDAENGEAIFIRDQSLHGTRDFPAGPGGHIDVLSNGDWLVNWGHGVSAAGRKRIDEVATQVDGDTGEEKWSLKVIHNADVDYFGPRQEQAVRAISLNPVALTDVPAPLGAEVIEEESAFSYSTTADRPAVVVAFNRPVVDFAKDAPSVSVTGATIESVSAYRKAGVSAHAYKFVLEPDGDTGIAFTMAANKACDSASAGICTADGTVLSDVTAATYTVPNLDTVEFEQSAYTVAEGATVDIKVTLSVDPGETVSIPLTTTSLDRASADDYSGVPTSLSFNAGETSKTITFDATQDTIDDDDESVVIGFGTLPTAFSAGRTSVATVEIVDDDLASATVSFDATSYTAYEGGNVEVAVSLDNALSRTVTIPLTSTEQDGATSGDYSIPSSVTFAVDETSTTFEFTAPIDSTYDPGESVVVAFGSPPDGIDLGSPSETTITISDPNPPQVKVSFDAASYTVDEGGRLRVDVTLDKDPEREVVVPFTATTLNGATNDDIDRMRDSVTFRSGVTTGTFGFVAADDDIDDDGESIRFGFGALSAGVSAGAIPELTATIIDDDDPQVSVSFNSATYAAAEGEGVTVTVDLNADPERTVAIPLTTSEQGGATGNDYSGVPSTVTFEIGETQKSFTVTATDDADNDDDESVVIGFGALPDGVTAGSPSQTTVEITDDEPVPVTVSFGAASYSVTEGGSVTIHISLDTDPERTVTIPLTATGQSGATDDDFGLLQRSVNFQSGSTSGTLSFTPTQDDFDDDGEQVVFGFGALPTGVSAGSTPEATVAIIDDDAPAVTVRFGSASHTVDEGESVTLTLELNRNPERTLDILISPALQGGVSSDDFTGVPNSVTFNAGETQKTFAVTAVDDAEVDPQESVRFGFGALPAGVSASRPATTTVSLVDDDIPPPPTPPTQQSTGGGFGGFGGGGEPVNLPPQFRQSASETRFVPENSAEGVTVGKPVSAWDPENQELAFSLRGEDAGMFTIDEVTGQIAVGAEALLDFETKDAYVVDIVVSDALGKESVTQLEIHVTDVQLPGMAGAYDMANNHNEVIEREEVLAAAAAYMLRRITKPEMVEITKLYFTSAFPPIRFGDLAPMVNKYDINRDDIIDRVEVLKALQDYFDGRISKADIREVVRAYFTTTLRDADEAESSDEQA